MYKYMYSYVIIMLLFVCIIRELGWHDLAFFNADLYGGLRRMMMDAKSGKTKEEFQATYCCYFEVQASCASF